VITTHSLTGNKKGFVLEEKLHITFKEHIDFTFTSSYSPKIFLFSIKNIYLNILQFKKKKHQQQTLVVAL